MDKSIRGAWLAGAAAITIIATGAEAQTAPPPAEADAADQQAASAKPPVSPPNADIIVTGTSIRGITAVGSSAVSVTREQLAASGHSTPTDVLRELPQVQGLGFDETPRVGQNGGGNLQRGSTVNLRGLGSNATLLLVDGKRIAPTGNVYSFTEANQLPTSAIERIEVIADGASAIYGSDAVAGVVNYITRKRFKGMELTLRGTGSAAYTGWGASFVTGKDWGTGGFVLAYDHDDRGEMMYGQSPYLRQDLRSVGGPDNRVRTNTATAGLYANIVVPRSGTNPYYPTAGAFDYYGINPNSPASGTGLTAANLLYNQANLADANNATTFLPHTVRNQVSLTAEQDIGERLHLSALAFYNRRESTLHSYVQSAVRTLPSTSPYYIAGVPGVAPGAAETVDFSLMKDVGIGTTHIYDVSYQGSLNATYRMFGDWKADAGVNFSRDKNCANCIDALAGNLNTTALQAALNNGTYNPFSTTAAPQSVLAAIFPAAFDKNRSSISQYDLRFGGSLFNLPGGTIKGAIGGQYLYITQWRSSIGVQATVDVPYAYANRTIKAGYAELFVPLLGEGFTLPGIKRLMLDAAVRTEHYSDVGSTTNPKVGLTWDVVTGLSLRGAWGTSFRAPNLIENNPAFFSNVALATITNLSGDPSIGLTNAATNQTNVLNVSGSNAQLLPETATNYSFGFDVKPSLLRGLNLSFTYYNIHYQNQIIGLQSYRTSYLASPANRALYAPYIVAAAQPSTCVNGNRATYNPLYAAVLVNAPANIDESQLCTARAITYSRNANASDVRQNGIDVLASYRFDLDKSHLTLAGSFTKILGNKTQVVNGGAVIDGVDIVNYPVSLRGRGSVTWNWGPLTITPAFDYVGSYVNNIPIVVNGAALPNAKIPSWTTYDLTLVYDFDALDNPAWAKGMNVALNLRNLTNKQPPVVLSSNGNGMDTQNANPYGIVANLQVTKRF
ncbi:TonB-dependent receptor domain-containing protein [Novosphingobium rosa]|uniref:TonB-dependent receptor domain-containing protein n=1 Tax=Novosphingobium rosa TaxID=76978 RepID=UPI000836AA3D|nr:TonB-dependent receptor [Novosphingobium rosa]